MEDLIGLLVVIILVPRLIRLFTGKKNGGSRRSHERVEEQRQKREAYEAQQRTPQTRREEQNRDTAPTTQKQKAGLGGLEEAWGQ